jgi:hypothetical protein
MYCGVDVQQATAETPTRRALGTTDVYTTEKTEARSRL